MEPLVPACVDLQDFAFMPLDVVRVRDSMLAVESSGDEFRAAVLLWCVSWHQVPAASLPDDDRALSLYAGYGRAVKEWRKVRAGALRGFVSCSDGRLYHPVLAEKAREAWEGKLKQRWRTECARIKKAAQRANEEPAYPSFEEWAASQDTGQAGDVPSQVPRDVPNVSPGTPHQRPPTVPRDNASKGQGEGQGQGEVKEDPHLASLDEGSEAAPRTPGLLGDDGQGPPAVSLEERRRQRAQQHENRVAQITDEATEAYNRLLAQPNGLLAKATKPGRASRLKAVRSAVATISAICEEQTGSKAIGPGFWDVYFGQCADDPFLSGKGPYRPPHENWRPGFKHLLKPETITSVYEKTQQEAGNGAA